MSKNYNVLCKIKEKNKGEWFQVELIEKVKMDNMLYRVDSNGKLVAELNLGGNVRRFQNF